MTLHIHAVLFDTGFGEPTKYKYHVRRVKDISFIDVYITDDYGQACSFVRGWNEAMIQTRSWSSQNMSDPDQHEPRHPKDNTSRE